MQNFGSGSVKIISRKSGNRRLAISIQPSRNIHAEHPQHESSREHIYTVQVGITLQPRYSVEAGEKNNDGNSIGSDCTHGQPAFHFRCGLARLGSRADQ